MNGEFVPLAEILSKHGGLIQTGPFGSQLHQHEYTESGVPVVMPKDIVAGRVEERTVARISEQKASVLSRHELKPGDIVFPRRGEISKCALIDESQAGFLCGTGCLKVELPKSVLHPRFVYYYLGLRHVVEWLEKNAVGTTMLNLNTGILGGVKIPVLALSEQQRIADVLSAYDDLIENNRRRIKLLEDAARLLYREWFVHQRFPGHEHLKLVDGAPEGWEKGCLSDCAYVEDGDWIESKDQGGDDYRLLQVSNVGVDSFVETGNLRFVTAETFRRLNCREVVPGQILVSRMPDPIGRAWLVTKMPWKMITAVDVAIVEPKVDRVTPHYLIQHLNSSANLEMSKQHATGATRLRVTRRSLCALPILIPPLSLQISFSQLIEDSYRMRSNLDAQISRLVEARDLLVPRLMSGELAV